jgi:nucleoid-associated protein YgaU
MSTAALAAGATTQVTSVPEVDGTRPPSRRRIAGTTTERLPVRACSGDDLGRHVLARRQQAEIEPSALRLTRRGRMLLTTVSVLIFGSAVAVLGLRVAGVLEPAPQFSHTISVQVGAGQSLWSIAQETNPTENPASVVGKIADLNNLRTPADITPGQTLQVPTR